MKLWTDALCALCAIAAAILWLISSRAAVWADEVGKVGPRRDSLIIEKNGRLYNLSASVAVQSQWSAAAASAAALLQAASVFISSC